MKDEIKEILVISNSPARDIQEFSRYCKSYIDKCESHKIYLKDGYILRFHSSHNLDGVRKYYLYHEIFETYLKNYITNLQEENERLKNIISSIKEDYLNEKAKLDKAIDELDKFINSCQIESEHNLNNEKCLISVRHSKKVKSILNGDDKE